MSLKNSSNRVMDILNKEGNLEWTSSLKVFCYMIFPKDDYLRESIYSFIRDKASKLHHDVHEVMIRDVGKTISMPLGTGLDKIDDPIFYREWKKIIRRYNNGTIAGYILHQALSTEQFNTDLSSIQLARRTVESMIRSSDYPGDKNRSLSERHIKTVWSDFKKASHLWLALMIVILTDDNAHRLLSPAKNILMFTNAELLHFLKMSEDLRERVFRYRPTIGSKKTVRASDPLHGIEEAWKVPEKLELPNVDLPNIASLPDHILDMIRKIPKKFK